MSSPNKEKLVPITPPHYEMLVNWWNTWPQGRPELLDFWARGNFTRRLLDRKVNRRSGCVVRVQYIDEMELALKRLALLGIEIDFAWAGTVSPPDLVMAPQHIDYEDSGGWGYSTASGDKIDDGSGKWEWCPTMGYATLLPDTVTDWMATEAVEFFKSGQMVVCPMENIGPREPSAQCPDEYFGSLGNSISISRTASLAKVLFELDLPMLEGMSLRDTYAFSEDNGDSLVRLRNAIWKLQDGNHKKPQWRARTGPWSIINHVKLANPPPPVERLHPYHWLIPPHLSQRNMGKGLTRRSPISALKAAPVGYLVR